MEQLTFTHAAHRAIFTTTVYYSQLIVISDISDQ